MGLFLPTTAPALTAAAAKDEDLAPNRAALLQAERQAKVKLVEEPRRNVVEKGLRAFNSATLLMGRIRGGWKGIRFAAGEFPSGAGFNYGIGFQDIAVGSLYEDPDLPNRVDFAVAAATSTNQYHQLRADIAMRNLGGSSFSLSVRGNYYEHPRDKFYGLGLESREDDRTSYLNRSTEVGGKLWFAPTRRLGLRAGILFMNPHIGSGSDPRFPSTEEIFDPATIPGFEVQPDMLRIDGAVAFDWRDRPLLPRSGGYYEFQVSNFKDQEFGAFDFRQFGVDLQHYLPWLQGYRVLALRAAAVITDADPGQDVPFYLMPHLGGGERLRGFREFRFRDRSALLLTSEYRWEAWWALDMALFGEAGKVAPRGKDLDLEDLEGSYGIGFRFHAHDQVVLRVDLSVSREGFIPFLRYHHVF